MKHSILIILFPLTALGQPTIDLGLQGGIHTVRALSSGDLVAIAGSMILRINDDGTIPWAHDLGGEVQLLWLEKTNADVLITAGRWTDSLGVEVHAVTMAFDATGALLWGRMLDCGADEEYLTSMSYQSGSILLATVTNPPYQSQALIRLFDTGTMSWAVAPTSLSPHYDRVHAVGANRTILSTGVGFEGKLIQVNGVGQVEWSGQLVLDGSDNNSILDIAVLAGGDRLIVFRNSSVPTNAIHTVEVSAAGAVVPGTARAYLLDSLAGPVACMLHVDGVGERTFSCYHSGSTHTLFQTDAGGSLQWTRRIAVVPNSTCTMTSYSNDHLAVANSGTTTWATIKAVDDLQPDLPCFVNDTLAISAAVCTMGALTDSLALISCIPNTFTPTLTPITVITGAPCGPVAVGSAPADHLTWRLYPVPVEDRLYVVGIDATTVRRVEVLDAMGRPCMARDASALQGGLDVGSLPPGPYVLRLLTEEASWSRRFIRADQRP